MINLRYHIVSITAVFLALGIGLAFGAAFIDRATVEALNSNLAEIEAQNTELERANGELSGRVAAAERLETGLREQGLVQLLDGRLAEVPVLLLASAGVDDEVLEAAEAALTAAGAEVPGVLTVTERFALDDPGELEDLRTLLELPDGVENQLRVAVTRRVRSLLAAAAAPGAASAVAEGPVPMPPLVQQLLEAGFLELDPADEPPAAFALLPASGLRILAVSGADADVADADFLQPLLEGLVRLDPVSPEAAPPVVVAAQPLVPDEGETDANGNEIDPLPFVGPLREDEELRTRLSTVDHLDSFAGLVAAILALQHGGDGQLGHYGLGDGAQSLLPTIPG